MATEKSDADMNLDKRADIVDQMHRRQIERQKDGGGHAGKIEGKACARDQAQIRQSRKAEITPHPSPKPKPKAKTDDKPESEPKADDGAEPKPKN